MSPPSEESTGPSSVGSDFLEESFQSQYRVLRTLGRGSNAKVQLAHHRLTGAPVAVKVLLKKRQWCQPVMSEAQIMMMTDHPNIVSLLQVIECEKRVYLVMELAEGKQLYQHIREEGHLPEDEARLIFRQVIAAVSYCHNKGIVHRDLKPDNIMVDSNGGVKIIDFGLGTQVKPGQRLNQHCGAYSFGAPELFLGRLYDGPKVDVWTLGVVLYFMVVGNVPFDAVTIPELRRQVVSGHYAMPPGLSEELQDLLRHLLTVNPRFRPTVTQVMAHPWLREDMEVFPNDCEEVVPTWPDPAIVEAMKYIGFQAQDIKDSLHQRKYNQTMASYCLLQGQALQGHGCTTQARPRNPGVVPFPSLEDPAAFPPAPRRRGSEPTLGTFLWSLSSGWLAAYGQQACQKRGRNTSGPGLPPCRPLQKTPTLDHAQQRVRSAPCFYLMSSTGENTEDTEGSREHSVSTKSKSACGGQPRGVKGWASRAGSSLRRLCCCFPPRRKPRRGQSRVSPQE